MKGDAQKSLLQPALGFHKSILHVIHTEPAFGDQIVWSYFDGNGSTEVGLPHELMHDTATLATLPHKLLMVHTSSTADHDATWPNSNIALYDTTFK